MAKDFNLGSKFDTDGVFWEPFAPNETFPGRLSRRDRNANLSRAAELVGSDGLFPIVSSEGPLEVLHGLTTEGPCSLIGCHGSISTHMRASEILVVRRYNVSTCIMGCYLEGRKSPQISSVSCVYSGLDDWLSRRSRVSFTEDEIAVTYPRASEVLDFCTMGSRLRILMGFAITMNTMRHEVKSAPQVLIEASEPQSLEWLLKTVYRFENLLTLLLGTSVRLRTAKLQTAAGDHGSVVQHNMSKAETPDLQQWVMCDARTLVTCIDKWFGTSEEFHELERLLYSTIRHTPLMVHTEFLSLAQAIESFHRVTADIITKRRKKRISFRERISALLSRITKESQTKLLGDIRSFEQTLQKTRDCYTHLGLHSGPGVLTEPKETFLFNQKLHALLRLLMLLHLGFSEEQAVPPTHYQAKRWH